MYSSADLLARTIYAEASNQPREGQLAVAHSILNRLKSGKYGGDTMQDVLFKPWQFEPWMTRRDELLSLDSDSEEMRKFNEVAVQAMQESDEGRDPTGGATHFLNPDIVKQRRGGALPNWFDQERAQQIGDHWFTAADNPEWRPPPEMRADYDDQERLGMPTEDAAQDASFDLQGLTGSSAFKAGMGLLAEQEQQSAAQPLPAPQLYRPQARKRGSLRGLLG